MLPTAVRHPIRRRCHREPSRKIIGLQNKVERDRKKVRVMPDELSTFWKDYLDSFHFIVNFGDYQALLDHIVKLMGPISSGSKILDAGCGNGNFGTFLFMQELFKSHQSGRSQQAALTTSEPTLSRLHSITPNRVLKRFGSMIRYLGYNMNSAFHCVDLNAPFPFQMERLTKWYRIWSSVMSVTPNSP